ncbi:hypothetical protein HED49_06880 [Ochrobactrum daejeonense]|nr:hypothetical protein [Brucella daejeonensis]
MTTDVLALSKEVDLGSGHCPTFLFTFKRITTIAPRSTRLLYETYSFQARPFLSESVASRTNKAVRTILDAEVDERVAKTLRLRKQRQEMESIMPPPSKRACAIAGSVELTQLRYDPICNI